MRTYACLANWTQQGIANVKDSAQRLKAAKKALAARGTKITSFYMTLGQYDMVFAVEAESDAEAAKGLLETAAGGSVRTVTMRTFSESGVGRSTRALLKGCDAGREPSRTAACYLLLVKSRMCWRGSLLSTCDSVKPSASTSSLAWATVIL